MFLKNFFCGQIHKKHSQFDHFRRFIDFHSFANVEVKVIITFSILLLIFQVKKNHFMKNFLPLVYNKNSHPDNRIVFCFRT